MLSPQTLHDLPNDMVDLVNEVQEDILRSIAKKLVKADYLTPSAEWQLYKAAQLRMSTKEINELLAKYTGKSVREIKRLYTAACKEAISNDAKIYRAYGKDCSSALRSVALSNTLNAGIKNAGGMTKNLCRSMVDSSRDTVTHLMDKAWLKIQSGAFSYQDAIFDAVSELARNGITKVTYASGRTDWADVAVRRAVMTGVSQTAGRMQLDLAAEMDCDLVEVTAHMGARPSHAMWQGKVYSISGKSKKYPKLSVATGYGTGAGLKGWNCRHDFYPFFEGLSKRANMPVDIAESNKQYALSQRQRAMERTIRASKRRLAALDGAISAADDEQLKINLQKQFDKHSAILKEKEKRLDEFCADNDLFPENDRVRVVGFGKSVSQKAVHGNNRNFVRTMKKYGIENPPKSLDKFKEMKYNNSPEYKKMNSYIKSVKRGKISPLIGYDRYSEVYEEINDTLIGLETSDGIKITGQSEHLIERVFGVIKDPDTGLKREGVSIDEIKEALTNGTPKPIKLSRDKNGNILYNDDGTPKRSQKYRSEKCEVSINPDTGVLIQCNPKGG